MSINGLPNADAHIVNPLACDEEYTAASHDGLPKSRAPLLNSPVITDDHVDVEPVTVHLSSNLRQRLSIKAAARVGGVYGSDINNATAAHCGKDEDFCGDAALDSTSSSTTSPQFRRNNPYATSQTQSMQLDDAAGPLAANASPVASGVLRSPLQVSVVLHTSSARVSRTTSVVKAGDARVSRTTSVVKAGDNSLVYSPQLPLNVSSLPGSAPVSRTTSMEKTSQSIVFSTQPLRFAPSQADSTPLCRTTSLVKGGSSAIDFIPVVSQSSSHPPHPPPPSSVSPLLNFSLQSFQPKPLFSGSASAGDSYLNQVNKRHSGNAAQLMDVDGVGSVGGGVEGSTTSSPTFQYSQPFRSNASESGAVMPPYSRSELYGNEAADTESGVYDESARPQDRTTGPPCMPHPSFTQHYHHYSLPDRQRQHTPERPIGCYTQLTPPGQRETEGEAAATAPFYSHVTGYAGASLPFTFTGACEPTPGAYGQQDEEERFPQPKGRGFEASAACEFPLTAPQDRLSRDHYPPSPLSDDTNTHHLQPCKPPSPQPWGMSTGEAESVDEDDEGQLMNEDPTLNPLLSTQPPRPRSSSASTHEQETRSTGAFSAPLTTTAANIPGFTVGELTATLEAALKTANEGETLEELWCPAGSQFSLYDAGMREHYVIPSEKVALTRGAIKYVSLFERYGNQTRFRFQLCNRYLHNRCNCGLECQYIHSHFSSKSTQVHMNENSITTTGVRQMNAAELAGGRNTLGYPTMERGMVFAVFPPNQLNSSPQVILSEMILVTEGALQTYRALGSDAEVNGGLPTKHSLSPSPQQASSGGGNAEIPILRPRHCAHFQFKRMCNLGASCHFIHSLIPFVQGMVNQPPLPCPINWAALGERSAGFVLPRIFRDDACSEHHGKATSLRATKNQKSKGSKNKGNATPFMHSVPTATQPWAQPTAYRQAGAHVVPMGDPSTQTNTMFASHYPQRPSSELLTVTEGSTVMYGTEPAHAGYAAWGPSYPQSRGSYAAPMAATASFGVHYRLPNPAHEQQQQRQQPSFITDGMSGFHPSASFAPQAYPTFANHALPPPPHQQHQPWPPMQHHYF